MNLEKATEILEAIKTGESISKCSEGFEIAAKERRIAALTYFIQLASKLEEGKITNILVYTREEAYDIQAQHIINYLTEEKK